MLSEFFDLLLNRSSFILPSCVVYLLQTHNTQTHRKTFLKSDPLNPSGGGGKGPFPPLTNLHILSIGLQYFMSSKIYILADFWNIFCPARNFCGPVDLPEVKKTIFLDFFRILFKKKPILMKNKKNLFFWKFNQIYKKRSGSDFW